MFTLKYSYRKCFFYIENENGDVYALEENNYSNSIYLDNLSINKISDSSLNKLAKNYMLIKLTNLKLSNFKLTNLKLRNFKFNRINFINHLILDNNYIKNFSDCEFNYLKTLSLKNNPIDNISNLKFKKLNKFFISSTVNKITISNLQNTIENDSISLLSIEANKVDISNIGDSFTNYYFKVKDLILPKDIKLEDNFNKNVLSLDLTLANDNLIEYLSSVFYNDYFKSISMIKFINGNIENKLNYFKHFSRLHKICFKDSYLNLNILKKSLSENLNSFEFKNLKSGSLVTFDNNDSNPNYNRLSIVLKNMDCVKDNISILDNNTNIESTSLYYKLDNVIKSTILPGLSLTLKNTDKNISDNLFQKLDSDKFKLNLLVIEDNNYFLSEEMLEKDKIYEFKGLSLSYINLKSYSLKHVIFKGLNYINFDLNELFLQDLVFDDINIIFFNNIKNFKISNCTFNCQNKIEIYNCHNLDINNVNVFTRYGLSIENVYENNIKNLTFKGSYFKLKKSKMFNFNEIRVISSSLILENILDLVYFEYNCDNIINISIVKCVLFKGFISSNKISIKRFLFQGYNTDLSFLDILDDFSLKELTIHNKNGKYDYNFSKFTNLTKFNIYVVGYNEMDKIKFKGDNIKMIKLY